MTEVHVCKQIPQYCSRQRGGRDSNPRPVDHKSSILKFIWLSFFNRASLYDLLSVHSSVTRGRGATGSRGSIDPHFSLPSAAPAVKLVSAFVLQYRASLTRYSPFQLFATLHHLSSSREIVDTISMHESRADLDLGQSSPLVT